MELLPGIVDAAEMYSHEMKVEDDFEYNPWSVEDVSVFLKYCCPECDYQILDYDMFANHAEKKPYQINYPFWTKRRK